MNKLMFFVLYVITRFLFFAFVPPQASYRYIVVEKGNLVLSFVDTGS